MNKIVDLSCESPDNNSDVELVDVDLDITRSLNDNFNSEDIIPELADFIKKCLNLENSKGMLRVLKKSLLRAYQEASPDYIQCNNFKFLLFESTQLLERGPHFKFSYIKSLCENLNDNKRKRRAELKTLGACKKRKRNPHTKRKEAIDIIDLDGGIVESVIVSDDSMTNKSSPAVIIDHIQISDTEEPALDDQNKAEQTFLQTLTRHSVDDNESNNGTNQLEKVDVKECEIEENMLLVTQKVEDVNNETLVSNQIIDIENELATLKKSIENLEMAEVTSDSPASPYVQCQVQKKKVVDLYKKICQLTNCEPVKRHEIRLKPINGYSEGPAKILETILNNNLRSDGYPPFPTFHTVNTCVRVADIKFNLNWNPIQIANESTRLFTQCGQKLQRLRQKREWYDLMSLVKTELEDPAEKDAELNARLEANKEIAIKKETEILERYVMLEKAHKGRVEKSNGDQSIGETSHNAEDSDTSECSSDGDLVWEDYDSLVKSINFKPISFKSEIEDETISENVKKQGNENQETDINALLNGLGNDFTTKIVDIEDPYYITVDISDSSDEET